MVDPSSRLIKIGKNMAKTKKTVKTAKPAKAATAKSGKITNLVQRVTKNTSKAQIAQFRAGDTVNVFVRVKEGEKERVQVYKGLVTKIQGAASSKSFTVRKISAGVGVERTFPFASPIIDRVELISIGQVRRSKLYYLRGLEGKAAKIDSELAAPVSTKKPAATAAAATDAEQTEA
jgi:large subunit ribosomal protein L19